MWIQILLLLALAGITGLTWRRASQQAIRPLEALAWTVVWVGAALIVCLPGITTAFANIVGIGRGADLVVYLGIFILFILVFHLHVVHDRMEKSITELVREETLRVLPTHPEEAEKHE